MKSIIKMISLMACMATLIGYTGCSKDESTTSEEDGQLGKLSSTWHVTSAMKDNAEQDGYADLTLILSGTAGSSTFNYSASNRPDSSPWPASGMWTFGSNVITQIIRDKSTADELPMTYTVTDTALTLDFQFSGIGYDGSRVNSAEGHWAFTFSK